ncbi:hypothetical protein WG66_016743 [Moniliophthora roreri]|nr:hypothetical protein WG66_016743 [Moniliophthora roreri]
MRHCWDGQLFPRYSNPSTSIHHVRHLREPSFAGPIGVVASTTSPTEADPMKIDVDEVLTQLEAILNDRPQYLKLLSQRGSQAQTLLNLLQTLSNIPPSHVSPRLRSSILKAMVRLSKRSKLYPDSLAIHNVRRLGEHPVDSGRFGEIWRGCFREAAEQVVCLKVVKLYARSDVDKVIRHFLREAILWRQLDHPNVLPFLGLYFLDSEKRRLCLISPWMENGNLVEYLENTPRSDVDHRMLRDIIHADLKGVNILMTSSGRATIADFGLARIADGQFLKMTSNSNPSGGTTRWLAPELLGTDDAEPSYESDIYALGCYSQIYAGRRPFHHITLEAAVIFQVIQGKRPTRPDDRPELEDSIWSLIMACWQEEPSARPAADEVLTLLEPASSPVTPAPSWDPCTFANVWTPIRNVDLEAHGEDVYELLSVAASQIDNASRRKRSGSDAASAFSSAFSAFSGIDTVAESTFVADPILPSGADASHPYVEEPLPWLNEPESDSDPAPFRFKPYTLANMLDPKSYEVLQGLGGIEGVLRGLGTDATHGLDPEDPSAKRNGKRRQVMQTSASFTGARSTSESGADDIHTPGSGDNRERETTGSRARGRTISSFKPLHKLKGLLSLTRERLLTLRMSTPGSMGYQPLPRVQGSSSTYVNGVLESDEDLRRP